VFYRDEKRRRMLIGLWGLQKIDVALKLKTDFDPSPTGMVSDWRGICCEQHWSRACVSRLDHRTGTSCDCRTAQTLHAGLRRRLLLLLLLVIATRPAVMR